MQAATLSEALRQNAKHEARLSNISDFLQRETTWKIKDFPLRSE
jgi:hypothetical protein